MSNYLLKIAFIVALELAGVIGLQVDQSMGNFMSASLIHRDSPMSPFYNSSKSQSEILGEAVTRSLVRINYMNSPMHMDAVDIESVIMYALGDYLVKIHSGEEEFFLILFMGAAFTWINCDSSEINDHPKEAPPIFRPSSTDSYKSISFDSIGCLISPDTNRDTDDGGLKICQYQTRYRNIGVSKGEVSQATFHLDHSDGTEAHFRLMFGCSHSFLSLPYKGQVQGIIGLGYGDFPFVMQLATQADMEEKISYCLPPYHSKDHVKIIFGEKSVTSDVISNSERERVTLPFRVKTSSAWYYLTLQSVGYNGKYTYVLTSRYNTIIDSGIAMTTLDEKIFNELVVIMSSAIPTVEFKVDGPKKKFEFCYDQKHDATFKGFELTFRFDGGILTLREENIFAEHPETKNLKCMMIKPTNDGPMVLGSYAQINHLVEFHFIKSQISLVRADCGEEFGI